MPRIPPLIALTLLAVSCNGSASDGTTTITQPGIPPQATTTVATPTTGSVTVVDPPSGSLTLWVPADVAGSLAPGVDAFSAATGVEVTVVERTLDETLEALRRGDIPDVFYGHHAWIGELASGGVLEPIFLEDVDGVLDAAIDAFTLRGTLYGVPLAVRAGAILRNTALVGAPVESTVGFGTACLAVDEGDPCILVPSTAGEIHFPYLAAGGGYLFGYDDTTGYDRADQGLTAEGASDGFAELEALVGAGRIAVALPEAPFAAFTEGRAAFLLVGPDQIGDAIIALGGGGVGFSIEALPGVGGATAPPLLDVFGLFVNAHGDNKVPGSVLASEYLAAATIAAVPGDGGAVLAIAADGVRRPQIAEADLAFEALQQAAGLVYEGIPADQALEEAARTLRELLEEPDQESGDDEGDEDGG
jgi:maltose/maltodextrin transport system substrate-binding protein